MNEKKNFTVSVFKKDKPVLNILMAVGIVAATVIGLKCIIGCFTPEQPKKEEDASSSDDDVE